MNCSLSPFVPGNLVSRDGFGRPVSRQPVHLHTQAESGAYLRESSRVPRRRPFIYLKPPYAIGSAPSLSGHTIPYRWPSLPRVRRHRASKPQGSSYRALPWQVTMDQLIYASLFPHPLLVDITCITHRFFVITQTGSSVNIFPTTMFVFVCISLTADGPQRARLPIQPTATLLSPSC